jgi:hypothetical protein
MNEPVGGDRASLRRLSVCVVHYFVTNCTLLAVCQFVIRALCQQLVVYKWNA